MKNFYVPESVITNCCDTLEKRLNSDVSRDDFFLSCVQKKLNRIYEKENDDYDNLLHKLEVYIDYDDPQGVKQCVVKILKLLSKNRKNLLNTLKELM